MTVSCAGIFIAGPSETSKVDCNYMPLDLLNVFNGVSPRLRARCVSVDKDQRRFFAQTLSITLVEKELFLVAKLYVPLLHSTRYYIYIIAVMTYLGKCKNSYLLINLKAAHKCFLLFALAFFRIPLLFSSCEVCIFIRLARHSPQCI